MFRLLTSIVLALITVTGCGRGSDKLDEIKQDQREILFRLGTLTKEIEQAAARAPAAADAGSPQPKALDIVVGDSPVKGPHDARVTIVEFSDFQCPACKTYDAIVNQVLEQYPKNVRLAYKQFPLAEIHPNATNAAKAALAAGRQGKFWEMHDIIYQNQDQLGMDNLKQYARKIGLDVGRWEKDLGSPEVQQQLSREADEGRVAGVDSTPSFFVNGRRVSEGTVEEFKRLIQESLDGSAG